MEYVILYFGVMCFVLFFYQMLILPALRLSLRYELFSIRDKIRSIRHNNREKDVLTLLDYMERSACLYIKYLPVIDVRLIRSSGKIDAKEIENRKKLIDNCKNQDILKLFKDMTNILVKAVSFNSGGLIIIMAPFIVILLLYIVLWSSLDIASHKLLENIFLNSKKIETYCGDDDLSLA